MVLGYASSGLEYGFSFGNLNYASHNGYSIGESNISNSDSISIGRNNSANSLGYNLGKFNNSLWYGFNIGQYNQARSYGFNFGENNIALNYGFNIGRANSSTNMSYLIGDSNSSTKHGFILGYGNINKSEFSIGGTNNYSLRPYNGAEWTSTFIFNSLIGIFNSSVGHNNFAVGTYNYVGDNNETINGYGDGFAMVFGMGSSAIRNYDLAFGYHSIASGGENIAIGASSAFGSMNISLGNSLISGNSYGNCNHNISLMNSKIFGTASFTNYAFENSIVENSTNSKAEYHSLIKNSVESYANGGSSAINSINNISYKHSLISGGSRNLAYNGSMIISNETSNSNNLGIGSYIKNGISNFSYSDGIKTSAFSNLGFIPENIDNYFYNSLENAVLLNSIKCVNFGDNYLSAMVQTYVFGESNSAYSSSPSTPPNFIFGVGNQIGRI
jgi:hypothetical protein